MEAGAAKALREGRHGRPFEVLGWHETESGQGTPCHVIRAHVIGAERLELVEPPLEFTPHGGGIFTLEGADLPRDYRLRAFGQGGEWLFDDPYRFAPVLGEVDEYLISEGAHYRLWERLGAHLMVHQGVAGCHFALWAPHARRVSLVGDFNFWNAAAHPMRARGATGVWEIFIPDLAEGALYKFDLLGPEGEQLPQKADPFGFGAEHPPATASVVRALPAPAQARDLRAHRQERDQPISIYEVHLGSWRRRDDRRLSYLELASELVAYVKDMGFTHIELMPVTEFPFDGSWGYQPVGLYAPTVRHGTAREFQAFVQAAQGAGLGVILDWVPAHFPTDSHGLGWLDGTALYHYADPREGFHRDWNTLIFDYGKREVRNYLVANALYWLEVYGLDGLRVDAVASMLYRDYSREEWLPNIHGGRENLEAIGFLQEMNRAAYGAARGCMTVAEESTSFPKVSQPVEAGGLGFGYKWNMGWMNDTLAYMREAPIHRQYHHDKLTFGAMYAYAENFILPLSHDEVVHGKGSMLGKMQGDDWQRFANLRAYYGFMWGWPGKKLLFMGCEFAQEREWNHDQGLDWHLLSDPRHAGMQAWVRDLNALYRGQRALHAGDCIGGGFEWLVVEDKAQSVLAWLRHGAGETVLVICNFTPVPREGYQIGLPLAGRWEEALNSDALGYGGSGMGNLGAVETGPEPCHGQAQSARFTLPPLSCLIFTAPQGGSIERSERSC